MNTRLQVEHPVTELITGLDLVGLQLRIAAGEPIPDEVKAAEITGHAIEARLYAEDVAAGYLPVSGTIEALDIPAGGGVRVDAGYATGSQVSIYYDSMLAKVIAHGPSRDAARRALAATLDQAVIHGVATNRDLLVAILRHEEFAAGRIDTGFLTRHPPAELLAAADPQALHLLAAALAGQARRRDSAPVLRTFPSGWRNNPSALQHATFGAHVVGYRITGNSVYAEIDGTALPPVIAHSITPTEVELETTEPAPEPESPTVLDSRRRGDGNPAQRAAGGPHRPAIRRTFAVHQAGDVSYVDSALGHSALAEQPRFAEPGLAAEAGALVAPMPGTVVRIEAVAGEHVERRSGRRRDRGHEDGARDHGARGRPADQGPGRGWRPDRRGHRSGHNGRGSAMTEAVSYTVVHGVAWLTIERPEARNALNQAVRDGLWDGTRRFNADDDARVLVLTGAGDRAFCAGADLKEMAQTSLQIPPPDFLPQFGRNIDVPKPVIAAVNGVAWAGGFLLAQCCDLCLAADTATFAISEVKVGRGAPWAAPLSWLLPPRIALQILLTGDPISAQRARELGLVNDVVPAAELRDRAQALAERIAANAPLSVRAAKRTAYLSRPDVYTAAEEIWAPVYRSADAQEGPAAFRDKRQPVWTGR